MNARPLQRMSTDVKKRPSEAWARQAGELYASVYPSPLSPPAFPLEGKELTFLLSITM